MTDSERKGMSGLDKALVGCGLGCAALIVAVVLSVAIGAMWLVTPGQQAETEAVGGEDSLGVIRLNELADDPGTQQLFARVLERVDETNRLRQREQLPPAMRWLAELDNRRSPASLNIFIPREMTIALERSTDGDGIDYVVALNPRAMVRGVKTMLGLIGRADESGAVRSDHRGHPLYRIEDDAHLAFVRSTVLVSSSRYAVVRAIDRLEAAAEGGGAPRRVAEPGAIPEGDWDLEGVLDSESGLIASLLEAHAKSEAAPESTEPPSAEDLRLGFGFDIVSAHEVAGRTVLDCATPEAAERWSAILEQRYQAMRDKAAARGLELEIQGRVQGRRVVIDLEIVGLEEALVSALNAEEEAREGS